MVVPQKLPHRLHGVHVHRRAFHEQSFDLRAPQRVARQIERGFAFLFHARVELHTKRSVNRFGDCHQAHAFVVPPACDDHAAQFAQGMPD